MRYTASYADLIQAFGADTTSATRHYVTTGYAEGRAATFDAVGYLPTYPDLQAAGIGERGALEHRIGTGFAEGRIGDTAFGREQGSHDLTIGGKAGSAIGTSGDHDRFMFEATAGQKIVLDLDTPSFAGVLALHDSSGRLLAIATDANATDHAAIRFTAEATGSYYLEIAATASQATGAYGWPSTHSADRSTSTAGDHGPRIEAGDFESSIVRLFGDRSDPDG